MDINLIRTVLTVAAIAAFFGIVWWAYAPSRKSAWQRHGQLDEDDKGAA
jgi:cbb3-type cytochrome oxidase subunit 3